MVVSSSCQSAAGVAGQAARYENQTFDLPSAFLQAGVEVYVGTLWSVVSRAAERFVEGFYGGFLSGKSLGVCLQQGKRAIRGSSVRTDRLAFIMYGDPHARPGELFPAMRPEEKE